MSNKVPINKMGKVIKDYLENYYEDIENDVIDLTDNITKEAVKDLQNESPKGKGTRDKPYHKGWRRQKVKSGLKNHRYAIKIHNATNYQLTHLLEFGHATRNGGRTKAIPHIRPIEEKYAKEYEKSITTAIRRRKNDIRRIKNKM